MWTAEKAWAGRDNSVILTPRYKDSLEGNILSPRPKLVTCVLIRMREEVGDKEANLKKKIQKDNQSLECAENRLVAGR